MTYGAFEAFRRLIVQFRTSEIDMSFLSDDISEMTSDPEVRREIAVAILAYLDNLDIYSFSAIKTMTSNEKDEFREQIEPLVELYISDEYFIDQPVITIAQQLERDRIRHEREKEKHEFLIREPKSRAELLKFDQFTRAYFCPDCGEKIQGLFNLDDHLVLMHSEKYIKRVVCEDCTGMWLTNHVH